MFGIFICVYIRATKARGSSALYGCLWRARARARVGVKRSDAPPSQLKWQQCIAEEKQTLSRLQTHIRNSDFGHFN